MEQPKCSPAGLKKDTEPAKAPSQQRPAALFGTLKSVFSATGSLRRLSNPRLCGPCPICIGPLSPLSALTLPCTHTYHTVCLTHWLDLSPTCPLCRRPAPHTLHPLLLPGLTVGVSAPLSLRTVWMALGFATLPPWVLVGLPGIAYWYLANVADRVPGGLAWVFWMALAFAVAYAWMVVLLKLHRLCGCKCGAERGQSVSEIVKAQPFAVYICGKVFPMTLWMAAGMLLLCSGLSVRIAVAPARWYLVM